MSQHIHFGILDMDPDWGALTDIRNGEKPLPLGFTTDGDSFLVWGEGRFDLYPEDKYDDTLHVIALVIDSDDEEPTDDQDLRELIPDLRLQLWNNIGDDRGLRLMDYVVVTDAQDWGENQRVWLLDGTMS